MVGSITGHHLLFDYYHDHQFWEEWTDDIMDNKKTLKLCYII